MTNSFIPSTIDANTVAKLAEINVKAVTDLVNNQAKLFNDLLSSGLNQLKSAQSVKDVNDLVEANNNYTKEVETKLRTTFDANSAVLEVAGKQGLDVIVGQQKSSSSK